MTETVTVACKLPNGLLLTLDDMVDGVEPSPQGFIKKKVSQRRETQVRINGFRTPQMFQERPTVGGYGLTHNVDKEFFDEWLRQHKDMEIVTKKLVFAYPTEPDARAAAKEHAATKSGLEPYIPPKWDGNKWVPQDPRHPKSINPNLTEIGTDNAKDL